MLSEVKAGWPSVRLDHVAELCLGKMLDKEKNKGEPRPYLANTNVRWGSFDLQDLREMRFEERELERYGLRLGDIVMCEGGEPGRCAIWIDEVPGMMIQKALHRIRPMEGTDSHYLYYALTHGVHSGSFDKYMTGSGIKHLPGNQVAKLEVLMPPLAEQRRIAEVLRSVDEAIALSKETIGQVENASRGLLQRLFVEGLGHSDFKEGCSSQIPASWQEMSLSELSAIPITYGVVQPGPSVPNGIRFIRGGDFPGGKIDMGVLRTISPELASQYRRTRLEGGEVLVSLVGYPGACTIVPDELAGANVNRAVAVMRPTEAITSPYLYHFISSPVAQARLKKETIGSAQQVINLRDLKEIVIPVPPKHEQDKIAAILGDLDDFAELEKLNLNKLTALKANIAADLVTGRRQVPA
tara:strand:- start:3089 stop:4321 length:1233 start_codon:yes stop_codon:yes gene_type:complete